MYFIYWQADFGKQPISKQTKKNIPQLCDINRNFKINVEKLTFDIIKQISNSK